MRIVVLLLCLLVSYVSLPITTRVVAQDGPAQAADADQKPDESQAAEKTDDSAAASQGEPTAEKADAAKPEIAPADAAKPEATTKEPEKKKRKTHTVATKRLKVDVTVDATFAAEKMTPVALRPEAWSQFEIEEVVQHGSEVHKGQTLIRFDDEDIDRELAELELELRLSELAIMRAEEELPRLEKTLAMNAAEAERLSKTTREDYDRYHEIDRPMIIKSADFSLRYAQFMLDYEQDELEQLEKMYEADDLTEETEELVLERQRNAVEFAKFNVEQTKLYRDEVLNVRLPRNDIRIKESLEKVAIDLAKAKTALALDLNRARYELEQQKKNRAKALDRHAKLTVDRGLMEIKAPADGIVYYGECEYGRWSDMASMIAKLKPHNSVSGNTVLMTIVERRPLEVLAQIGEDDRPNVAVGQSAQVIPPNENAERLAAKVASVSAVPVATGKFAVQVNLTGSELPEWIVPGVNCKVKINTYDKADALVVPKKAVHTDNEDDEIKYVWLVDRKDEDAKPERRNVKLGRSRGEDQEILSGLAQGDVVSLEDEEKKEEDKS